MAEGQELREPTPGQKKDWNLPHEWKGKDTGLAFGDRGARTNSSAALGDLDHFLCGSLMGQGHLQQEHESEGTGKVQKPRAGDLVKDRGFFFLSSSPIPAPLVPRL